MIAPVWWGLALAALGAAAVAALGQGTRGAVGAGLAVAAALVVGFGPGVIAPLALFVLGAGALTRLGRAEKEALGAAEGNKGRRGAAHVLAKLGIPAALGLLAAAAPDARPGCAIAATGALAGAFADTAATEIGPLARGAVYRWNGRRLSRAAHGTPGGMSAAGLAAGALASAATAAVALWCGVLGVAASGFAAAAAGFAACMIESAVGASAAGARWGHFARNVLVSALSALLAAAAAWGMAGGSFSNG